MTSALRGAFKGALIVARRDLLVNVRSVRFVVLSLLVFLVMIGAAFGISGFAPTGPGVLNEYVAWTFATFPTNTSTNAVALIRVTDYAGVPHGNLEVQLGEPYSVLNPNAQFRVHAVNSTDAQGWVRFGGLTPAQWPVRIQVGQAQVLSSVDVPTSVPLEAFTVSSQSFDVVGDLAFRDFSLQAVLTAGSPLAGIPALLNGTGINGTEARSLDAQGFLHLRLDPGSYNVTVRYGGQEDTRVVVVRTPAITNPLELGPDFVLYFMAFALMGLFAPIVAIALSYDAITKERQHGGMELLLVRPASRTGLAVGKFLGTFASVGLPILGVVVGALSGVALVTGRWPDLMFDVAFLLGTLALIATYVLIMQVFSTVAKSPGTAMLSAILVWLVFNLLWNVVFLLVEAALGIQGGTEAAFALSTVTLLFNPTGVYQLTLAAAFPPALAASAGTYNLPNWTGPVAFGVWIAVLLVLAVIAFRKRAL